MSVDEGATREVPVNIFRSERSTTFPRLDWMPEDIIVVMLQSKSIYKRTSFFINARMQISAHIFVWNIAAENVQSRRDSLRRQLLPIGPIDVLQIMILILFAKPFQLL